MQLSYYSLIQIICLLINTNKDVLFFLYFFDFHILLSEIYISYIQDFIEIILNQKYMISDILNL